MKTYNTTTENIETGLKLVFLPLIAAGLVSLIYAIIAGDVDPSTWAAVPALLTQNSKLKKTSILTGLRVFNFGIPAYRSQTGHTTCPFADTCVSFCYAKKGAYAWGNVKPAFEYRLQVTLKPDFPEIMIAEIKRKKADVIRIHDSGDFYSPAYLEKWYTIMRALPGVHFYAYTNSMPFFRPMKKVPACPSSDPNAPKFTWEITGPDFPRPDNFTVIFSTGGKFRDMRKPTDRQTTIFHSEKELIAAGYINASKNDLNAARVYNGENNKIGLVYH